MAIYTFGLFCLVDDNGAPLRIRLRLVTGDTGGPGMLTIQRKGGGIMVKFISLPCFCIGMACLAGCLSVFLKLPVVDIGMAFPAFTGQARKSLFFFHLGLDRSSSKMTIATGSRSMSPLQCISGSDMIEADRCPVFLRVTGPAIGSRIIFTADHSGVDILMTCDTGGSNVSESPLTLLQMTIITGRRHMRTTKRKRRILVLFQRVSCLGEWLFQCVALLAIT